MSNEPSQELGKQIKVRDSPTGLRIVPPKMSKCCPKKYWSEWFFIKIDTDRVFGNMQGKCYVKIIDIEDIKMEILLTV